MGQKMKKNIIKRRIVSTKDRNNSIVKVNDYVTFKVDDDLYEGTIQALLPDGKMKINALIGEYYRKPCQVSKII